MTTKITSQIGWIDQDADRQPVLCVANAGVRAINIDPSEVWLFDESQDQPEKTDWSVLVDVSAVIGFALRERPEIEAFRNEHAAFQALLPSLRLKYPGRFVAVHRGQDVDSDDSRERLVRRFFATFGDVPVYIGYVGDPPVAYQLTPFRF